MTMEGMIDRVVCGDSLKVMGEMPDDCVDIVVTSPPYNQLGKDRNIPKAWSTSPGMFSGNAWHRRIREGKVYADEVPEEDYQDWLYNVCLECLRVSKGLVWINHKTRYRNGIGIHPLRFLDFDMWAEVVWSRNGSMALNCKRFAPSHEYIFGFGRPHYWNSESNKLLSVWSISSSTNNGHPCSFPIEIPKRLIEASCPPGGIVCDPFLGSGSTAVAAIETGRHYIGIEIEQKYYDLAEGNAEQARKEKELSDRQLDLFGRR